MFCPRSRIFVIAWDSDTGATRELAEAKLLKLGGLGPALLHSDQGTVYVRDLENR